MAFLFMKMNPDQTPTQFAERAWKDFQGNRQQPCAVCLEVFAGLVVHRDRGDQPVCCTCAHQLRDEQCKRT